jgi:hypothetical protein
LEAYCFSFFASFFLESLLSISKLNTKLGIF